MLNINLLVQEPILFTVLGIVDLPAYQLINLGLNYSVFDNVSISSRVTNLFDKDYQTVSGYNSQERSVYFGMTYHN